MSAANVRVRIDAAEDAIPRMVAGLRRDVVRRRLALPRRPAAPATADAQPAANASRVRLTGASSVQITSSSMRMPP